MPDTQLVALHAMGLGPIDDAKIEFGPGFNVLTGETGAGKTLLIGALNLCLGTNETRGARPESTVRVAALFASGGREIALSREASSSGRLRASLNGLTTNAESLRELASTHIVIHGQHDSLRLRNRGEAAQLIDRFGTIDDSVLRRVRSEIRGVEIRRERFGGDAGSREREIEFLRFQLDEIARVNPCSPNELNEALEQLVELTSIRDHAVDVSSSIDQLDGEDDDAILVRLAQAAGLLPLDGLFVTLRDRLLTVVQEAREIVHDIRRASDSADVSSERFSELEARVLALQTLTRKYGGSLEKVLERQNEMLEELQLRESEIDDLAGSDAELEQLRSREAALCSELLVLRQRAATQFADAVAGQFDRVALSGAQLDVQVHGDDGSQIEFQFSPNPGRSAGPLQQLASGGELSRVLLAISLVTVADNVVAVFDEIDSGVGGSVAQQIGECLAELAKRQQVIVVTHLASIAARADRHFVVEKSTLNGVSQTSAREVIGEDRVSEVARMLAGESQQLESRALALRLLRAG